MGGSFSILKVRSSGNTPIDPASHRSNEPPHGQHKQDVKQQVEALQAEGGWAAADELEGQMLEKCDASWRSLAEFCEQHQRKEDNQRTSYAA
jgi:hypothetical protein